MNHDLFLIMTIFLFLCSILIVKVSWEEISCKAQDHGAEVNTVYAGTSPVWNSCRAPPKDLWLFSTLQCDWIGTDVIGVHGLQLGIDLLPELLSVSSGQEAGHDGGGDDQVAAAINPLHRVSAHTRTYPQYILCMSLMIIKTRTCSSSPGDVSDGSAPDVALVTEGLGPVKFVSL